MCRGLWAHVFSLNLLVVSELFKIMVFDNLGLSYSLLNISKLRKVAKTHWTLA